MRHRRNEWVFDKPLTRVLWCVSVSLLVSGIGLGSTTAEPRTGLAELHDHSHGAQRRGGVSGVSAPS